jgi:hypothetical protein
MIKRLSIKCLQKKKKEIHILLLAFHYIILNNKVINFTQKMYNRKTTIKSKTILREDVWHINKVR